MRTQPFGSSGIPVSSLGLGCSRLGSTLANCSGRTALDLLSAAFDHGITLYDTADIYGQGDSERLIGRAFKGRRDRVVLVTKAGQKFSTKQKLVALAKGPIGFAAARIPALKAKIAARRAGVLPTDFDPSHLTTALEASLRRLGTDRVEVFLLHAVSAEDVRQARFRPAIEAAQRAGKFRVWGTSPEAVDAARASLDLPGLTVIQIPLQDGGDAEWASIAQAAHAKGIAVMAREILARLPRDADGARAKDGAARAVAWATGNPLVSNALIGTTNRTRLADAVAAAA